MNYWHMQLHPDNPNWGREKELLNTLGLIGLGDWDEKIYQQEDFQNKMQIGDVVAIKCGGTPIALVEVTGDYQYEENVGDVDWFERRRKVKVLDWYRPGEHEVKIAPRATLTRCDIDGDAISTKSIIHWHKEYFSKIMSERVIKLLQYKHQVILQGPPGTGKTWLAKKLAKELTKPKRLGSPIDKIDDFFRNFDTTHPRVKERREELSRLLTEFQEKFPKEHLQELSLEEYAIGTGSNDSFCWWIERGLKDLGYYFPGSARSYLIYWNKHKEEYSKHTALVKNIEDDEEAMRLLAKTIADCANTQEFEKASKFLGDSFILKILHSYYPDEYAPINSVPCLNNALKLFGIDHSRMNPLEKNLKVQEFFLAKKKQFSSDITSLEFMWFLFENFDLKGKVSFEASEVMSTGECKVIQFHPAYSYEDFVRGIIAQANEDNQIEYKVENKILVEFAQKALDNPSATYVLVIDEINRANLPAVLGELILALEYRYDEKDAPENKVESMYALEGDKDLKLPRNLYIIGTMNTADRSVGHIDYAIRRRFAFVEMLPDKSVVKEHSCPEAIGLFQKTAALFCENYDNSEEMVLERSSHLSPEFRPEDVMIGHSYFLAANTAELQLKLEYEIKPILKEYLKDGVLLNSAEEEINQLNV